MKRDLNKVAKQFYCNHILAWVFSCKFAAYFQNTSGGLPLAIPMRYSHQVKRNLATYHQQAKINNILITVLNLIFTKNGFRTYFTEEESKWPLSC